jgi:hypothetical protein
MAGVVETSGCDLIQVLWPAQSDGLEAATSGRRNCPGGARPRAALEDDLIVDDEVAVGNSCATCSKPAA